MAITRKTKNRATSKVEVEQVYLDQLKGTIAQLERQVAKLTENVENENGLGLDYVEDLQLVGELTERLHVSNALDEEAMLAELVRGLLPMERETLFTLITHPC